MRAPRISAVAAVYNAAAYIESALPGLLSQLNDIDGELILVDDGSSDGSVEIAKRLTESHPRAEVVELPRNGGVARARLAGAALCRGDFVWFVDLDDEWDANLLHHLHSLAEEGGADVAICGAEYISPGGRGRSLHPVNLPQVMSHRTAVEKLLSGELKGHLWNKLFSRRLVQEMAITPSEVHSDLSMTSTMLAGAERVIFSPRVLYRYRVRPGSIIQSGRQRYDSLLIVEKVVRAAARRAGASPRLIEDFAHRFFLLSALKDSFNPKYSPERARFIREATRRRISVRVVLAATIRSDRRRAAALLAAKVAPVSLKVLARRM